jgi:hypothetical protein
VNVREALRDRPERTSLAVGIVALVICTIGALFSPARFYQAWLVGVLFWLGIALGCLAIQMIHVLTGGAWGLLVRRPLHAAMSTLPLLGVLFLPILTGMRHVYPWATAEALADPMIQGKRQYLNVPFFIVRAVVYFVVWSALAWALHRRTMRRPSAPRASRAMRVLGGPGLVAYGLTMSLAAVDWLMSLDPHWYSTIFGILVIGGQMLSAMAFVALMAARAAGDAHTLRKEGPLHDLGKLLLVFVMLWAYFSFSQYLIIYSGNMAEDIPWYLHRAHGGWQWLSLALVVLHFIVPFLVLLPGRGKRSPAVLSVVAAGLLVMRLVELFWFTAPSFHAGEMTLHWLDLVAPLGIGGLWFAVYLRHLRSMSATPLGAL